MQWISVKDKLPGENKVVIIGWENTEVDFGRFSEDGFVNMKNGWKYIWEPTHWMPLPEPPKKAL